MLQSLLEDLFISPRRFSKLYLVLVISLNPVFYAPENHFHENGLRTNPSTKQAAIYHCEESDKDDPGDHEQDEEVEVILTKYSSQDHKFPLKDTYQKELFTIDLNEWCREKEQEKNSTDVLSKIVKFSERLFRETRHSGI